MPQKKGRRSYCQLLLRPDFIQNDPRLTWSETVLHSFLGYGAIPDAGVIFDAAGNLYGTTGTGNGNSGIVYEITP